MDFVACLGLSQPSINHTLAVPTTPLFYEAFLQALSDSIRTYTTQRRQHDDGCCALSDLRVAHQRTREAIRRYRGASTASQVEEGKDLVRKRRRDDADVWVWVAFW